MDLAGYVINAVVVEGRSVKEVCGCAHLFWPHLERVVLV